MDALSSHLGFLPSSANLCDDRPPYFNKENVNKICKFAITHLNSTMQFLGEHPAILAVALPLIVSAGTPSDCQHVCNKNFDSNSSDYGLCVSDCVQSPFNATEVYGWCKEMCAQEPKFDPKECMETLFMFLMKP